MNNIFLAIFLFLFTSVSVWHLQNFKRTYSSSKICRILRYCEKDLQQNGVFWNYCDCLSPKVDFYYKQTNMKKMLVCDILYLNNGFFVIVGIQITNYYNIFTPTVKKCEQYIISYIFIFYLLALVCDIFKISKGHIPATNYLG